jgi:small-conductance mechanosensitive channel
VLARPLQVHDAVLASSFLVGGILLGVVLDLVIRRRLRRRGTITSWGGDQVVLAALRTALLIWFAVAGAAAAAATLPLRPHPAYLIQKGLLGLVVFATTLAIARGAADSVKLYSLRTAGAVRSSSIFVTLTRLAIFAVGGLILLQSLGVSITPLLTALGVGGLAVALALQDTLSNLFAGVHIIASKKVRLGDFVKLESGDEGYVIDISWRNTSIRTPSNSVIIVPNAKLAEAVMVNYYQPEREISVLVEAGVAYGSDLDRVEAVTIEVAREVMETVPGGVPGFPPLVRYHTLGDYAIHFTVVLRAREATDRFVLIHEFVKRIHERYGTEGIEIPYPVRTVNLRANGEAIDLERARSIAGGRRR